MQYLVTINVPAALVEQFEAECTGDDHDIILAAERAMRERFDVEPGDPELELETVDF